jgi:hypothetical protein
MISVRHIKQDLLVVGSSKNNKNERQNHLNIKNV